MIRGDESYGRNWGYYCLLEACRDVFERGNDRLNASHGILTGIADSEFYRTMLLKSYKGGFVNGGPRQLESPNFFIVPQGRCAEFLLFSTLRDMIAEQGQIGSCGPTVIISNGFFDTTAANAAAAGFSLETFTQPGLTDLFPEELVGKQNHFKGNLDVAATEAFLDQNPTQVCMILMTITNNWAAAQPVSMANIRTAAELARRRSIPFFLDACRFAENAWFIREFESGYSDKTIPEIVQKTFSYADGFTLSLKKDGLSNMGGILSFRDKGLFAQQYAEIGLRLKERQILFYGNDSYGGSKSLANLDCKETSRKTNGEDDSESLQRANLITLVSGRDLMSAVVGLYEVTKEPYLRNRINQVRSFAQKLQTNGVSVLSPPGGHAVYLDMDEFFFGCERRAEDFTAVGFTLELLKDYGIRAAEAGPFGWEWDKKTPELRAKIPNLVRFAVPRHVLSDQDIDYTVAAIKALHHRRHSIPNVKITRGRDMRLRHFSAGMKPIPADQVLSKATYLSEAKRQVSLLSRALDQENMIEESLHGALDISTRGWGQLLVSQDVRSSGWVSHLSNDHSPFEYSVVLDQETGEAELRFLIEAQPSDCEAPGNLGQMQAEALALSERIAKQYGTRVSLDRFNAVCDLFMPRQPDGLFAAWYSYASGKDDAEWKIYLNPCCTSGRYSAIARTRAAFERIGLAESWTVVEGMIAPSESVIYFSLDLSGMSHARAKVYISHGAASTASAIAQKHEAICPHANPYEIQRFCEVMAGGQLGPYERKPLLSCFAFTSQAPDRPTGTVHFPISAYADSDREIQGRIERYMTAVSVPKLYKKRYRKMISAVQRRPSDQGTGIHAWVSLKQAAAGKQSNTYYISPDLFMCRGRSS